MLLADAAKRFNFRDMVSEVICDNDLGVAIHIRDRMKLKRYEPLAFTAVKMKKRAELVSEEVRLLYVALTRAACRLVIFGTVKDLDKALSHASAMLPPESDPEPYAVLKSSEKVTRYADGATVYLSPLRCVRALDNGWCAAIAMDEIMLEHAW